MHKKSGKMTPYYVTTYSRNGIENYRIAKKQEQKIFYKKFLMYKFKKPVRLFQETAPLYNTKQNRLITKTGFLISWFLLYLSQS